MGILRRCYSISRFAHHSREFTLVKFNSSAQASLSRKMSSDWSEHWLWLSSGALHSRQNDGSVFLESEPQGQIVSFFFRNAPDAPSCFRPSNRCTLSGKSWRELSRTNLSSGSRLSRGIMSPGENQRAQLVCCSELR